MGFPILVRRHLYIESGPWSSVTGASMFNIFRVKTSNICYHFFSMQLIAKETVIIMALEIPQSFTKPSSISYPSILFPQTQSTTQSRPGKSCILLGLVTEAYHCMIYWIQNGGERMSKCRGNVHETGNLTLPCLDQEKDLHVTMECNIMRPGQNGGNFVENIFKFNILQWKPLYYD